MSLDRIFKANDDVNIESQRLLVSAKNVKKAANEFVRRPVQNRIAKDWIKKELQLRKG